MPIGEQAEYRFRAGIRLEYYMYDGNSQKTECLSPGPAVGELRRYDFTVAAGSLEEALVRADQIGRESAEILSWSLSEEPDCYGCYCEYRLDWITPVGINGVTDCKG